MRSLIPPFTLAHWRLPLVCGALALLSACGGGNDTPAPAPVVVVPAPVDPLAPAGQSDLDKVATLYGIDPIGFGGDASGDGGAAGGAGDGAPLKRAVVTLVDAKGNTVSGLTDNSGKFLLKYKTAAFTAPLVLRVYDAGGNVLASVTDESAATGKVIRASVNPLTDKIASDVLPPSVAGTDKLFDGSKVDLSKLAKAKADLVSSIQAALATAGVANSSQFDPVKSVYEYNGKGVDAVIESLTHTRDPVTGATILQAKLVAVGGGNDGATQTVVVTPTTPLATTSVALPSNPGLTFDKLGAWVNEMNRCLALSTTTFAADANCVDADGSRMVHASFKNSSRDFKATYSTLFSGAGGTHIQGSTISNPSVLFTSRSPGSTIDDAVVVEMTVNQPGSGATAPGNATPIVYTAISIFRRLDSLTRAVAGNWILYGNQRSFDWGAEPQYFGVVQTNPLQQANVAGNFMSQMSSGLRVNFSSTVFDVATRTFKPSGVYAVRVKGPGLPASGVVWAPTSATAANTFSILNKTGVIPAEGTLAAVVQRDFRMGGVELGTGAPLATWDASRPYRSDASAGTDFSQTPAFSSYQAEIYVTGSTTPIVETTRILAPIQNPASMAKIPLHDLTANTALITPPQGTVTAVTVQWARTPGAARIESAYAYFFSAGSFVLPNANVADAFTVSPTSTSVSISNGATGFPASSVTDYREVGLFGRAGRSAYNQSIVRSP